jgi:hypothetical protein
MSLERINRFVGNKIEHDMEISLIESRTRSCIERQREWDIMLKDQQICHHGMHRGQHGFPESIVDH